MHRVQGINEAWSQCPIYIYFLLTTWSVAEKFTKFAKEYFSLAL